MVSAAFLIAAVLSGSTPSSETRACPDLLAPMPTSDTDRRTVSTSDLLGLRDIGQPDTSVGGPSPLAVSPDGHRVAFMVSRADATTNTTCQGLVVLELDGRSGPRLIDSGGDVIRSENVMRGSRTGSGLPATVIPAWSPDGREITFLKRLGGRTQVWRAAADGGRIDRVTDAPVDVEATAWSADGRRIIYATRPERLAFEASRTAEGRKGYFFDQRVIPANGFAPQLPADLPQVTWSVDAGGSSARRASPRDAARLPADAPLSQPHPLEAKLPDGRRAGAAADGPSPFAGRRLWARARGQKLVCASPACGGSIRGVWWHPGKRKILFLRYEGWNNENTALFSWTPGAPEPHRILSTPDALVGCTLSDHRMLCLRESSLSPRRLVAIDVDTGTTRNLYDPNPDLTRRLRPRVERLRWRNDRGLPAWGDLVLPDGTPPPGGWPLVIAQYTSRGFLRGGTGDEVPILPLAAGGIAVFSFHRPPLVAQAKPELATEQAIAAVHRNWEERRSTHAALVAGLDRVFARGDIDPDKVGITGLSDGATTARYALVAGMPLRAASISTCCRYMPGDLIYGGTVVADEFRAMGFPSVTAPNPGFWTPISFTQAAHRLTTPLLMQLSDEEGLFALETFSALREQKVPVELRIFPDEYHMKWQPAHRAAVYDRNIDWFRFWLKGEEDPAAGKRDQYRRWRAWRERPIRPPVSRP